MSRKQFTTETKEKYIKLIINKDFEYALISFICEFEERYEGYQQFTGRKRIYSSPVILGKAILKNWLSKYNIGGMKNLKSKTGQNSTGRPKKRSINELSEHDRALYQEIMEEILEDKGIKKSIIQEKMKEKKQKNRGFKNHKKICEILGINRTSLYTNLIRETKQKMKKETKEEKLERLSIPGLIEDLLEVIKMSDWTIGREKLYQTMINNGYSVNRYVFNLHFYSLNYKSKAYKKNGKTPPKEDKYKAVWAEDYVKGKFVSSYPGEILHADIKYVKIEKVWWYLHVIIETYANKVLASELTRNRTAISIINLVIKALKELSIPPRIFHSDHGLEYANYQFKYFLEQNGIIQSMSPKGNSLANRPSEYWLAGLQREKLNLYNLKEMKYNEIKSLINNYIGWYNNGRVQKNLKWKTPESAFSDQGACV